DDVDDGFFAAARTDRLDPVKRVVQHRPYQLRHPGVENHELLAIRLRFDVYDRRHEHTRGSDDVPSGLEDDRAAAVSDDRQKRGGVVLGGRGDRPVVGDAETAAEIQVFDPHAVRTQLARETDDRFGGALQRLQVHDLRSDVDVQPDDLEPRARG